MAVLRLAVRAVLPRRLTDFLAGLERAVRAADFFRPGWTRAFFDKMKNLFGRHSRNVTVHEGPRTTSKTWIGRVDVIEPGQ
jgi:hypothetical protein